MKVTTKVIAIVFSLSALIMAISFSGQEADDVVVVSNPKTPELKMRIVFNKELSIGEVGGDENYLFGNSIYFNTDEEGNFYVSDSDNHRIQKYNPEGKYLLTIGRKGQGPGEFQSLSAPKFDRDDNLFIYDRGNNRIAFFDKNGEFIRQIRIPERYENLYINSNGFMLAYKYTESHEGSIQKITYTLSLFDERFNPVVEFNKKEIETRLPTGSDLSSAARYFADALSHLAFRPQIRHALADNDLVYCGFPEKYEICVFFPEGKLVKKILRDYEPILVNNKDKERFMEFANEFFSPRIFTDDLKKKAFPQIKYPKYKPAYHSIFLMENGWLAVIVDSVEGEYTLFDIFDQEGRYIGHFKTTKMILQAEGMFFEIQLLFKNGKAYTVATEDDYKFVKRYNIEIQEYKNNKWVRKK